MDPLALTVTNHLTGTRHLAHSALPDAPVVPDRVRRSPAVVVRSRATLAGLLDHAARVVEPAPACSPHAAH